MPGILTLIIGIAIFLGIFLALRQIMLWYWKVDEVVKNQELTNQLLANNNALLNEQVILLRQQIELTIGTDETSTTL